MIELDPDRFNRSRKYDPHTSKEAEQTIKKTAQVHAELIYDCLKQHGAMGKDKIKTICLVVILHSLSFLPLSDNTTFPVGSTRPSA